MALEPYERDRVARRVLDLCKEKGYRLETWLIAVNILDRFLSMGAAKLLVSESLKATQIPIIVTTVTIMAAKLEQPMTPSINRMIKLLTPEEEKYVDKQKVINMEGTIIRTFNFDFVFLSPQPFLDRYLRLFDHEITHSDETLLQPPVSSSLKPSHYLHPMSVDLLKFTFSRADLLWGRQPSLIAAAVLCIAHRLLRVTLIRQDIIQGPSLQKWLSLTNLWDNKMTELTGIKFSDFEDIACMIELSYKSNGGSPQNYLLPF
jgi:Cyclin, N-terminal domain/Cyclin, C-terminal domain